MVKKLKHKPDSNFSPNEEYIKTEAMGLPVEDNILTHCCFCDNAPPWPPSLSITRTESGLLYHCFRQGCGAAGHYGSLPSGLTDNKIKQRFIKKELILATRDLTPEELHTLSIEYDLTVEEIQRNGIKWLTGKEGIAMPIYSESGMMIGHNIKYFLKSKFKSFLFMTEQQPALHFPCISNMTEYRPSTLIVVEDILSAIRVSRFGQGVALLGTDLNVEKLKILLTGRIAFSTFVLALDPDALGKAVNLTKEFKLFMPQMKIASLSADPKDLSHEDLRKELNL